MRAALCRELRAEPHELSALAWASAYFFLLLCSYYLLRPVRDALAVEAGTEKLPWLFTGTFAAMLALVPAFGWLCARLPRAVGDAVVAVEPLRHGQGNTATAGICRVREVKKSKNSHARRTS